MFDPTPRDFAVRTERFNWQFGEKLTLKKPANITFDSIDQIIDRRRTKREFGRLSESQLNTLLWYTSRTIISEIDSNGLEVQHRPTPSAGALHPIHILIHTPDNQCYKYLPEEHSLGLCSSDFINSTVIRHKADELVIGELGTLIQLVAEPAITISKYKHAKSLIYRDAGVVLGYLSIVSEGLGLNLCALGLTGDSFLRKSNSHSQLTGVGLAWVGSRSS